MQSCHAPRPWSRLFGLILGLQKTLIVNFQQLEYYIVCKLNLGVVNSCSSNLVAPGLGNILLRQFEEQKAAVLELGPPHLRLDSWYAPLQAAYERQLPIKVIYNAKSIHQIIVALNVIVISQIASHLKKHGCQPMSINECNVTLIAKPNYEKLLILEWAHRSFSKLYNFWKWLGLNVLWVLGVSRNYLLWVLWCHPISLIFQKRDRPP